MGLSGDVTRLMDFCPGACGRVKGGIAYVCTIVGLLLGGILGMANAEAAPSFLNHLSGNEKGRI